MATPAGSRPGASRRAQYGLFFGLIATISGVVVGLMLLGLSLAAPQRFAILRGAALDVTAPVTGALRAATSTISGLAGGATNYWDAARQNGALRVENVRLRAQILTAKAVQLENVQLKAALRLREQISQPVAVGRIVGSSFQSLRRFAVLSAGRGDGVEAGMPVRSATGLIGQTLEVGRSASRVLLISDRANTVPGRLLRGGLPVLSTGRGDGTLDIRPLEVGRNPFRPGDVIITSGAGGLYPPMVPVALIVRLDDDGAIGVPLADPASTSFAIVERAYEPSATSDHPATAAASAPPAIAPAPSPAGARR